MLRGAELVLVTTGGYGLAAAPILPAWLFGPAPVPVLVRPSPDGWAAARILLAHVRRVPGYMPAELQLRQVLSHGERGTRQEDGYAAYRLRLQNRAGARPSGRLAHKTSIRLFHTWAWPVAVVIWARRHPVDSSRCRALS